MYFNDHRSAKSVLQALTNTYSSNSDVLRPLICGLIILSAAYQAQAQKMNTAPDSTRNYIVTSTLQVPVNSVTNLSQIAAMNVGDVITTVDYFDGLGRPLQSINVKGSPTKRDIIKPVTYDLYGRASTKYQPYSTPVFTNNGAYRTNAPTENASFYANPAPVATWNAPYIKANAFPNSETNFEPSPVSRITEQSYPGEYWQLTGKTANAGHNTKLDYATNDAGSLTTTSGRWAKKFIVTLDANGKPTLVDKGSYDLNELSVNIIKDENWISADGKVGTSEVYKNKNDQVILKRAYNTNGEILSTYYVYDDFNNLTFVLPPSALADGGGITIANLNLNCYQYRFDTRNRLVEKKLPGSGTIFTVFNKLDQIVATQDSMQRTTNQWTFLKYDALGRAVISGNWNNGNIAISRVDLQNQVNGQSVNWETRNNADGSHKYYSFGSFPTSNITAYLTINYYDDYNIPALPSTYNVAANYSNKIKGLITASLTGVLNTSDMLWSVQYYDDFGRVVKTYYQHYLGSIINNSNFDEVANQYNFNSSMKNTMRVHRNGANSPLTISDSVDYDHNGRLKNTWESLNGSAKIILSKLDYNEVGERTFKHIYSKNNGVSFLQDVLYRYNERGWLNKDSAGLFVMQLVYNDINQLPFNGNISKQSWGVGNTLTNNYLYTYDKLNRITSGVSNDGFNETGISYDRMGNLKTLTRIVPGQSSKNYVYTNNGNQVTTISGISASSYLYDGNGNVRYDPRNDVTIAYNILNLPQSIGGSKTISYRYDAAGNKLRSNSSNITSGTTDYINGIQYKSGVLELINSSEGLARKNSNGTFTYEFTLDDHLGNSRVIFNDSSGVARIVQKQDYYPFGLVIPRRNNGVTNEFLFNGKEFLEELKLYDFGARIYDPVIARWNMIDPLAEKYSGLSPYIFAGNNPVKKIDPNGRDIWLSLIRDKNGNITDLKISATVFVKGAGASKERAKELTKFAAEHLKSKSIDGVNVSFDVQYKYDENITTKQLKEGENILSFKAQPESDNGGSVEEGTRSGGSSVGNDAPREITVLGSGKDNYTIFHETLHELGLSDRYDETHGGYNKKTGLYDQIPVPHDGFPGDVMSQRNSAQVSDDHLRYFLKAAVSAYDSFAAPPISYYTPLFNIVTGSQTTNIPYNQMVDQIRIGGVFKLLTDHEETPYHVIQQGNFPPGTR
ncbi:MAG: DUF6443 domain-containing protein [Mucilaginibacter sp.]|uniref:RHS repeat domain-containing protein n=1 Tax=Mucilaginibacter sp. TaxID=1882438 RepID=UPI003262FC7A